MAIVKTFKYNGFEINWFDGTAFIPASQKECAEQMTEVLFSEFKENKNKYHQTQFIKFLKKENTIKENPKEIAEVLFYKDLDDEEEVLFLLIGIKFTTDYEFYVIGDGILKKVADMKKIT